MDAATSLCFAQNVTEKCAIALPITFYLFPVTDLRQIIKKNSA